LYINLCFGTDTLVPLEDLHMWKPEKVKIIKKAIDSKRRLPLPRTLHI
jgi:hypothetical protein